MASAVLFAMVLPFVYQKEQIQPAEWIDSCYGYNCDGYTNEPSIPSPYNYSSDYCKVFALLTTTHEDNSTTKEYYILTSCNL